MRAGEPATQQTSWISLVVWARASSVAQPGRVLVLVARALPISAYSRCQSSDQRHQLLLRISIAVDVALGGLDRPVTGQQLHVAKRSSRLVNQPRSAGDECASA